MADQEELDIIKEIDDKTTAIGVTLSDLRDKVKTGMTPAEVAEVKAALQGASAHLTVIAADPDNPVPPAPVV